LTKQRTKSSRKNYKLSTATHMRNQKELDKLAAEHRKRPSGKWRQKYECRKAKGAHEYKRIKPRFLDSHEKFRVMSVEEYYESERKQQQEWEKSNPIMAGRRKYKIFGVVEWLECVHCGHGELHYEGDKKKPRFIS